MASKSTQAWGSRGPLSGVASVICNYSPSTLEGMAQHAHTAGPFHISLRDGAPGLWLDLFPNQGHFTSSRCPEKAGSSLYLSQSWEVIMTFDFQQFYPCEYSKGGSCPDIPRNTSCWRVPDLGIPIPGLIIFNKHLVQWHWEQPSNVITFPNLLRSAEKTWNHSESHILPGVDMKYLRHTSWVSLYILHNTPYQYALYYKE